MGQPHDSNPDFFSAKTSSSVSHLDALQKPHAVRLGFFALVTLSLHGLMLGTLLIGVAGYERYCRIVDGSSVIAGIEILLVFGPSAALLIVDYRASKSETQLLGWQKGASKVMAYLSLGYVLGYVAVLRAPWLLGQAAGSDRITLWSARLSSTVGGVPLLAFAMALGLGLLMQSVSAAALRAFRSAGYLDSPRADRRFGIVVWALCATIYLVGLASIVAFATGGSI
jgi:hypothetical protein